MSRQRSPHTGATAANGQVECLPKTTPSKQLVPQTSTERLCQNLQPDEGGEPPSIDSNTILYLAYGSNLCHETFQGRRKIKPLSQVNVSVPTLRFTLNLPGIPYQEPCFATVDFRKIPSPPKMPDVPKVPPFDPKDYSAGQFDGGLMGVVYEVTKEDWRNIMRTEGGGSGYQEIVVPCVPLPPSATVPEKPTFPDLPRPILARTLYAPYIEPGSPEDPHKGQRWWQKLFFGPYRPHPDYSQASARYLKLITDGAKEHSLPEAYQEYLNSLEPYTITSWKQNLGRILLAGTVGPIFISFITIAPWFADENGKYPPALSAMMTALFNISWLLYDKIFKPWFGDGEHTEKNARKIRRLSMGQPQTDEEKSGLLNEE